MLKCKLMQQLADESMEMDHFAHQQHHFMYQQHQHQQHQQIHDNNNRLFQEQAQRDHIRRSFNGSGIRQNVRQAGNARQGSDHLKIAAGVVTIALIAKGIHWLYTNFLKNRGKLNTLVKEGTIQATPSSKYDVGRLESMLRFKLPSEYVDYLTDYGTLSSNSVETYGLGVPEDHPSNVYVKWADLSKDPKFPPRSVPLNEIGDGHYYIYDCQSRKIYVWATPNKGYIKKVDLKLNDFLTGILA